MEKIKKIKEDIDLKELEKYGFEKENIYYVKYTNDTYYDNPIVITIDSCTRVINKCYCWTRRVSPIFNSTILRNNEPTKPDKYIKDLIKAGYVEEI